MSTLATASEEVLVPVGDVPAMAQALQQGLDPARRRALGGHAAAAVRARFDLSTMVQGFERQFAVLSEPPQRAALRA